MSRIRDYSSLVKFSHTVFAMPFALVGFFTGIRDAAGSNAALHRNAMIIRFFLVLMCMVFARNAAMAFNRYLDRRFDALNPRTALRELPSGTLSGKNVIYFTALNAIGFVVTAGFINPMCLLLSPVALFVILFYSYTKRFTALCHLVLGLGLSLAPIGAYIAVTGNFAFVPVMYSLAVLCWVAGFDIIYALQDVDFDKSQNLNSIPVLTGKKKALWISSSLHVITPAALSMAGYCSGAGLFFWIGLILFTGMLIYQHLIVKPDDLRRVNMAFMTANGVASVIFGSFVILDIFIN